MRPFCWLCGLLAVLLQSPSLAYGQQTLAGAPVSTPTRGFRSADIGGRTLRYLCAGTGSPTVVVEQGMAISMETTFSWKEPVGWAVIFPRIAAVTHVCVYDRAGLGTSTRLSAPATSADAARDLHALLDNLRIGPPYVLARQSLGGMDALAFASAYPAAVAGMVLIDSSHPQQQRRFAAVLPLRQPGESEILRGFRDGPDKPVMGEWFNFPGNTQEMRRLPDLRDAPLIVLTHDPKESAAGGPVPAQWQQLTEPVWQQLQSQLAALSTRARQVIVAHAGHNIQYEQPQVVADAILDVVRQVRTH